MFLSFNIAKLHIFYLNLIVKKKDKLSYLNTYLSWDLNILQSTLYSPTFKILLEVTGTTENPSITDHQNMTSTFINITQTTGIRNRSMRTKSHTNISCRDCSYILGFFLSLFSAFSTGCFYSHIPHMCSQYYFKLHLKRISVHMLYLTSFFLLLKTHNDSIFVCSTWHVNCFPLT